MASDQDQPKDDKASGLSKTISWLRKFYLNFTAGIKKDKGSKIKSGGGSKSKQTNQKLFSSEPDIMLLDKDKIRTSASIYRDHPPDFPTTEQIKARLIAAEKYYGVPRDTRPIGEGMVFEEDADDIVQIRPSWAYILERPLVEQYVLMSNYIRRLSAMSEMRVVGGYGVVGEETRENDDDLDDGVSCVTGRSSLSYLGSMYVRPATSPSEKDEKEDELEDVGENAVVPAIKANKESFNEEIPAPHKSLDAFYPNLDDDAPQSSYEKQEIEITCPPRTSLVIPEKDLSHESSLQKLSGSRDSFLEFRNMRVENVPERQVQVVMERTTEIKANRMIVDESVTLNQREIGEKTVRFACPLDAGGGVSRIARIFESGTSNDASPPVGMRRVQFKHQEPIQVRDGNLLSRKPPGDRKPGIERIPLPSFSGSESGNDSPGEDESI